MKRVLFDSLLSSSPEVVNGKGKNVIPPPESVAWWKLYLEKFKDPIVMVLLVVFVMSIGIAVYEVLALGKAMSVFVEPLGVLVALLLSTIIGFVFEQKANNEFQLLNKVKNHRAVKVYRRAHLKDKAKLTEVPRCDVVVGDIVRLDAGDEVPADGYVLYSENLSVDESIFTGELYAHKSAEDVHLENATYPNNFLLRGTTVIDGYAIYRVSAVGLDSEEGKGIVQEREGKEVETPLNEQLAYLSKVISIVSFVVAGLILVGRMVYYWYVSQSSPVDVVDTLGYVVNSIMIAVTLVVVAVPEGLPMSVTVSLALSMRKMLKTNNLVRKLHACETMGATTIICTDKTGTLTQNKMEVVDAAFYDEALRDYVIKNAAVNSTAELDEQEDGECKVIGNPTEGALLKWITAMGHDYRMMREEVEVVKQHPFSTETKQMDTTIQWEGKKVTLVKGAPELVLRQCAMVAGDIDRTEVERQIAAYQSRAMRTLGFAMQIEGSAMLFLGVVAIADPVREDVPGAIYTCTQKAKVRVIIVTGDNKDTAAEIARQIGLLREEGDKQQLDGPQFAAMTDEELQTWLPTLKILSRAKPEDKARLVNLLQAMGEVVAVTGDGTNDALALSKAQVGISMGSGTARAKEASDITIIDNSFASINNAILWGRSLYLNIRRFIVFQMTINVCACLIVMVGAFMGLDSPLTVTQMLWVNLIMDTFAAMALSSLPADPKVMNDAPRSPHSHIIDRKMLLQILGVGVMMFVFLLGLWQLLWHTDVDSVKGMYSLENLSVYFNRFFDYAHSKQHLNGKELGIFFSTFVLLQFWNIFNVKYFRTNRSLLMDVIGLFSHPNQVLATYSKGFVLISLVIVVGQIMIVQWASPLFNVSPLSFSDWCWTLLTTSVVLWIPEVWRCIKGVRNS
ncbi:MAG: calcium-translocating P-type ATPase, PMCA-type [Paludibacteraceae bacterium]|nr:calcium-translocating P-type ATPase, PMCA-type [Paludibacteraceae bacterium]